MSSCERAWKSQKRRSLVVHQEGSLHMSSESKLVHEIPGCLGIARRARTSALPSHLQLRCRTAELTCIPVKSTCEYLSQSVDHRPNSLRMQRILSNQHRNVGTEILRGVAAQMQLNMQSRKDQTRPLRFHADLDVGIEKKDYPWHLHCRFFRKGPIGHGANAARTHVAFRCSAGNKPELSMWPPSPILNLAAASRRGDN